MHDVEESYISKPNAHELNGTAPYHELCGPITIQTNWITDYGHNLEVGPHARSQSTRTYTILSARPEGPATKVPTVTWSLP